MIQLGLARRTIRAEADPRQVPLAQDLHDSSFWTSWLVVGPVMTVVLFATVWLTSAMLIRVFPLIGKAAVTVERGRNMAIDGLRGYLGVAVFIHHTAVTWLVLHGQQWAPPPTHLLLHLGQTSVTLFFMITAFLFWGRTLDRRDTTDWFAFLFSRAYRLYPIYLVVLGLVVCTVLVMSRHTPMLPLGSQFAPAMQWLLMLGTPDLNGVPNTGQMIAGVTWSLRYEWLFYLSLPVLGCLFARSRQARTALLFLLVVVFGGLFGWRHHLWDAHILVSFAGGITAAYWTRSKQRILLARSVYASVLACLALLGVITFAPTAFTWPATLGLTVFFTVVASGNRLWGALDRPALLWLGDITYGVYLLHGFILWIVFQVVLPRGWATQPAIFAASSSASAIVLVLLSSLLFLTIERPAISLGRRHYDWLTARLPAARRPLSANITAAGPLDAPSLRP